MQNAQNSHKKTDEFLCNIFYWKVLTYSRVYAIMNTTKGKQSQEKTEKEQ